MTPFTIQDVYPWGRSLAEYRRMFSLSEADLGLRMLGCGDGPASFNAEMFGAGHRVISCDPLYQFTAGEIRRRIQATYSVMLESATRNSADYVWDIISSPEELGRIRMQAMDQFLADYEAGRRAGRYVTAALPNLPFADRSFDLALCSHLLFLYSRQFPLQFHVDAVVEMARVASEVRIFPLLDLAGKQSCHLEPLLTVLATRGLRGVVERVPYEFQRSANQMLRISR